MARAMHLHGVTMNRSNLDDLVTRLMPGWRLRAVHPFGADESALGDDGTLKGAGYGRPLRLTLRDDAGREQTLVWHTVSADGFGHDRRSDRAQEILLAYDTFPGIPRHVRPIDVGAVLSSGDLVSLRDAGELYLLTSHAPGAPYADDLRRMSHGGEATDLDLERCDTLARYLVELHAGAPAAPSTYRRAVRDLVGHGEGIFGLVDAYGDDVPAATPARLRAIEARCVEWRWRLRGQDARLARTHGDFHPFNVLFDGRTELAVLDASRGCAGDPADDATCMALNYVFFALDHPPAWKASLGRLWHRFWSTYLSGRPDPALFEVAPPFIAWRGLVMACPRFYPDLTPRARNRLLGFVEVTLERGRLDLAAADRLFA